MASLVPVSTKSLTLELYFSQCYRALKPLLWILIACGLDLRQDVQMLHAQRKPRVSTLIMNIVTGLFLSVCITDCIFMLYWLINYYQSIGIVCFIVNTVGYVCGAGLFRAVFVIKQAKFKTIVNTLSCTYVAMVQDTDHPMSIFKTTGYIVRGGLVMLLMSHIVVHLTRQLLQDPDNMNPDIFVEHIFPSSNSTHSAIKFVSFLLLCSVTVIDMLFYPFFVIFYLSACMLVIEMFKNLQKLDYQPGDLLFTDNIQLRSRTVLNFITGHQQMCVAVRELNELFKEIVAIWNFVEIIIVIFTTRSLNLGQEGAIVDREAVLLLCVTTLAFVLKTYLAAGINDKVMKSLKFLSVFSDDVNEILYRNKQCFVNERDFLSKVQLKCQLYVQYVHVDPPILSGLGLFVIRRMLIVTTAASILTYILVLYAIKN